MRNLRRALWIFSLVAATLAPAGAWAAGLGEAQLHSALSQALQLEIALLGEDASALDVSCIRLQAPRAPGDDLPWLTEARLSLKQRAGATYLLITTRHGIPHPALMVGVTIDCGTQVHREYPLLLAKLPAFLYAANIYGKPYVRDSIAVTPTSNQLIIFLLVICIRLRFI